MYRTRLLSNVSRMNLRPALILSQAPITCRAGTQFHSAWVEASSCGIMLSGLKLWARKQANRSATTAQNLY